MSKTEHLSLATGTHPDEWREGATCAECQDQYEMNKLTKANPTPMLNIGWLKNSNAMGITANEFERDLIENAKADGRDIRHVGQSTKARKERNEHYGTGGGVD